MFLLCVNCEYSDTTFDIIEHPDLAEALAVLKMLPNEGPYVIASAEHVTLHGTHAAASLAQIVGKHLLDGYGANAKPRTGLFDNAPVGVLRAAVEHTASYYEGRSYAQEDRATARTLREALFLREQRDRIAADLAEMERIGAMSTEAPEALASTASVRDGSGYCGALLTRAEFGCVLHEVKQ